MAGEIDKSHTPPPPYEISADHYEGHSEKPSETGETIPKSAELDDHQLNTMPANLNHSTKSGKLHSQVVNEFNKQHSCVPKHGSRRNSSTGPDQHLQFIDSLSAPRKFFSHITVEPLTFLAIVALYIEFPSIQDLIYTKICLQVVANHPNFTIAYNQRVNDIIHQNPYHSQSAAINSSIPSLSARQKRIQIMTLDVSKPPLFNNNHSSSSESNVLLHQNGRIGNSSSGQAALNVFPQLNSVTESRDHHLCDRLNRSAIPAEIRQEIIDVDSLFWLKYQIIICSLCALTSPYWGGMSDRIGRLIPLNVPIVMAAISNMISLVFGLLISLDSHALFRVEWLFIGSVLIGLSGGQAVLIVSSFSFISDNTSNESRSKRVAVLESVTFLSHSVGFYLSKHIMSLGLASAERPWFNRHFVAFTLCVTLNISAVLYCLLKLRHQNFHVFLNNFEREQQEAFAGDIPTSATSIAGSALSVRQELVGVETGMSNPERPRELTCSTPDDLDGPIVRSDRRWTDWGVFLTFQYYKQTYETTTKRRESRTLILLLLLSGFISAMSLASLMSLLFIYLHADPFNWDTRQYSSWNSVSAITRGVALVSLTLCMKFAKSWNVPDPLVAAIGFLSRGLGLLMIALAKSSAIIHWSLAAFVLSEYSMPPIRSLLSKLVVKEEVGKVYSCLAAMQSICFLLGNVVFYLAYTSLHLQDFFRLSFLVVAGFQFTAVVIMLLIYTTLRRRVMVV